MKKNLHFCNLKKNTLLTDQPTDRPTDGRTDPLIEMQFYIFVMFLGFSDKIHEEKPSFLDFENNWLRTDGRTDRRTDGRTDRPTDGPTDRHSES